MTPDRQFARHFAGAALTLAALYLAGRGPLAPPPLTHPSRVPAWWSGQGPVVAVFSAARVATLIAGLYWLILLGTVAAVGALSPRRLARSTPGRRLVGARRAVRLVLGASALGSAFVGGAAPVFAASPPGPGAAPTITNLAGPGPPAASPPSAQPSLPAPAGPGSSGTGRGPVSTAIGAPPGPGRAPTTGSEPSPTSTTSPGQGPQPPNAAPATAPQNEASVPEAPATGGTGGAVMPTAPAEASTTKPSEAGASTQGAQTAGGSAPTPLAIGASGDGAGVPSEWIVHPGDNLWFIAEQTLVAAWDRSPSDRQVAEYWMSVIAVNRSRLPDPSDPSLLFAGDVIVLPPVPWR